MALASKTFIRTSIALLVASGLVLLGILIAVITLAHNTRLRTDEVGRAQEVRIHAYRLLSLMQDAETGQRGFLLTDSEPYLDPYIAAKAAAPKELERLKTAVASLQGNVSIGPLGDIIDAKMVELQTTISLTKDGHKADAMSLVRTDAGRRLMDEFRRRIDVVIVASNNRVQVRLAELRRGAEVLQIVTIVGAGMIVLFLIGSVLLVQRYTHDLVLTRQEVVALNLDLENRVQARTSELQRANDEIQRFAYIVSHDLRAPLVNIMGFTSEMEEGLAALKDYFGEDGVDPEKLEPASYAARKDLPESIGFIRSSTGKMDMLINAILKLSREGGRVLTPEAIDLNAVMERSASSVRHQLAERNASVEVESNLPDLVSDRLALEQIFGNLIDNAVKYLSHDRPGQIEVRGREEKSQVVIEVQDNGRGIAPGDHERIFELFRRSGVQDRSGEGIGLAHVRALVRRLGGEITVDSELGRGSTFRVILPKRFSASAQGAKT